MLSVLICCLQAERDIINPRFYRHSLSAFFPYPPATSALTRVRMGESSPSMSSAHSSEYPQSFHLAIIAPVTYPNRSTLTEQ
ncbi:hypothetical protein QQF64_012613 [Cirrhinus molitorella]|uniref:Uncharacterized protein n=1 Tax=Cirrhinus molitorella TaxID=172907 RepID=A0ABR3LW68_9TELE